MTQSVDAQQFEASMRQAFLKRENLAKLFGLIMPHLDRSGPPLVYILTQSDRIGHFMIEAQILKTLYGSRYSRIIVLTQPMTRPGTNTAVRDCFADTITWIETDDPVLTAMGFIDGGLADLGPLHLLLASPRKLIVDFWRQVVAGTRPAVLRLPEEVRRRGHDQLRAIGIDPLAPFAFFHVRTAKYQTGGQPHRHRTTSIEPYQASIRRILGAGYQVVRIGEAGLEPPGWLGDGYVSLPDALPGLAPDDRAVDLAVLADAAFGSAQNSGPIWVAAAFGTPTLRTNTPFEHQNLPYNRDLTLFKRHRDRETGRFLTYPEILDRRLPSVLRDSDFDARKVEMVENTEQDIDAATQEFLDLLAGRPAGLPAEAATRFLSLGQAYEQAISSDAWFRTEMLDFYGYAHPFGTIAAAQLRADPEFLS
jgi:putative glycosyltransferase (TIGR04372 family)